MSPNKSRIETVLKLSDEIRELRSKVASAQEELTQKEAVLHSLLGGAPVASIAAAAVATAPAPKKRGRPKKVADVATQAAPVKAEPAKAEPKKRGRKPGSKATKAPQAAKAAGGGKRKQGTSGRIVDLLHAQGNKGLTTVDMAKQLGAANRLQSIRSLASRLVREGVLVKAPEGRYRAK